MTHNLWVSSENKLISTCFCCLWVEVNVYELKLTKPSYLESRHLMTLRTSIFLICVSALFTSSYDQLSVVEVSCVGWVSTLLGSVGHTRPFWVTISRHYSRHLGKFTWWKYYFSKYFLVRTIISHHINGSSRFTVLPHFYVCRGG